MNCDHTKIGHIDCCLSLKNSRRKVKDKIRMYADLRKGGARSLNLKKKKMVTFITSGPSHPLSPLPPTGSSKRGMLSRTFQALSHVRKCNT